MIPAEVLDRRPGRDGHGVSPNPYRPVFVFVVRPNLIDEEQRTRGGIRIPAVRQDDFPAYFDPYTVPNYDVLPVARQDDFPCVYLGAYFNPDSRVAAAIVNDDVLIE